MCVYVCACVCSCVHIYVCVYMYVFGNGNVSAGSSVRLNTVKSESLFIMHSEGKAIPVTGRGGPQGCETSRLHFF
jgi:hypothetical protein